MWRQDLQHVLSVKGSSNLNDDYFYTVHAGSIGIFECSFREARYNGMFMHGESALLVVHAGRIGILGHSCRENRHYGMILQGGSALCDVHAGKIDNRGWIFVQEGSAF
jgi:hypothetical protein